MEKPTLTNATTAIKRLLLFAFENYEAAIKSNDLRGRAYWDGYIHGLQHIVRSQS